MIVGILGSGADDSLSRRGLTALVAQLCADGAPFDRGDRVDLIDLKDEFRELHEPADYAAPPPGSQTARLRERIARASVIVLATPVYHGSFSGLLKNALDHLPVGAFRHRAVGLVTAGGGPRTLFAAAEPLRSVVRALGGWAAPTHVGLFAGDIGPDGFSGDVRSRMAALSAELRFFSERRGAGEGEGEAGSDAASPRASTVVPGTSPVLAPRRSPDPRGASPC